MKRLTILSLAAFVLLSVSASFAQQGRGMRGTMPGGDRQYFGQCVLDLTEEQQTKISQMRLEMQKQMTPLRSKVQTLRSEYKLMIIDEKISEADLKSKLDEISGLRKDMALKRVKHQRQVRSILTDEQKVKFDQRILSGRKHVMKGKRGFRGAYQKPFKRDM